MTYQGLTPEVADAIYDVLVANAGAKDEEYERQMFVRHTVRDHDFTTEYCFGGSLGWGGKFHRHRNSGWRQPEDQRDLTEEWRVNCYRENETPERLTAIEATNAALLALNIAVGPRRSAERV